MAILDSFDLPRIFNAAERAGFLYCDLYAEVLDHSHLYTQGKIEEARLARTTGVSLRCFDGQKTRLFSAPELTTRELLARLGDLAPDAAGVFPEKGDLAAGPFIQAPELSQAASYARKLLNEQAGVQHLQLNFDARRKQFEVATSLGVRASGQEENAHWGAEWSVEKKSGLSSHRFSQCGLNVQAFLDQSVKEDLLTESLQHSSTLQAPWPAPKGEIPLLWSPRAYAKLCLHFLRAFEGDLVLANHSFLTQLAPPLPLPFQIEEKVGPEPLFDYEGSPRRPLTLFSDGRPRGLACNNFVAEQLSVASTGHCRRESFQTSPTVAFWSPQITGQHQDEVLLPHLQWGLSVRDVEILHFNPQTADIRLKLSSCYLIHHGAEGEWVEPVIFDINLVDLLQTSHVFSKEVTPVGLSLMKQSQRLITELFTPQVLSRPIAIPGSVPLNYYW